MPCCAQKGMPPCPVCTEFKPVAGPSTCRLLPEHDECRSERARSSRAKARLAVSRAACHTLQFWGRFLASGRMGHVVMLQWPVLLPSWSLGDRTRGLLRSISGRCLPFSSPNVRPLSRGLQFIADNARLRCASWRFATMAPVTQLGFSCPVSAVFS